MLELADCFLEPVDDLDETIDEDDDEATAATLCKGTLGLLVPVLPVTAATAAAAFLVTLDNRADFMFRAAMLLGGVDADMPLVTGAPLVARLDVPPRPSAGNSSVSNLKSLAFTVCFVSE